MTGDIGKVYSQALFEIALESGCLDEINSEMGQCRTVFEENPELIKLLASPVITFGEKAEVISLSLISKIFGKDGIIRDFICVVTQKGRISYFSEIAEEFTGKYNEHNNIVKMTAITSVALKSEQREKLIGKLEEKSGKKVILSEKIDPSILGGIIVEYDNSRIDNSVKGKLEAVAKQLKQ